MQKIVVFISWDTLAIFVNYLHYCATFCVYQKVSQYKTKKKMRNLLLRGSCFLCYSFYDSRLIHVWQIYLGFAPRKTLELIIRNSKSLLNKTKYISTQWIETCFHNRLSKLLCYGLGASQNDSKWFLCLLWKTCQIFVALKQCDK